MNEAQYTAFVKLMAAEHAIKSTHSRRRGYEQTYFGFHRSRGTRLRGKYRPQ